MPWEWFIKAAAIFGLILSMAACTSDRQACSGSPDYWGCMNYYGAQRAGTQAAMSQAAAAQLQAATRPLYVSPLICGPYGCY